MGCAAAGAAGGAAVSAIKATKMAQALADLAESERVRQERLIVDALKALLNVTRAELTLPDGTPVDAVLLLQNHKLLRDTVEWGWVVESTEEIS
jgi:dihydrodipicolinate synthase/N-acetylneuraminate lyase